MVIKQIKTDGEVKIGTDGPTKIGEAFQHADSILIPKMSPREASAGEMTRLSKKHRQFKFNLANSRWRVVAAAIVIIVVNFILLINVGLKAKKVVSQAKEVRKSLAAQDLKLVKVSIDELEKSTRSLTNGYRLISWYRFIPFVGGFVNDGRHLLAAAQYGFELSDIVIEVIKPHADLIGFNGGQDNQAGGEKTASDRIDFIVSTLPELAPKMEAITQIVGQIEGELIQINPHRYPVKFMGYSVRELLSSNLVSALNGLNVLKNSRGLIDNAPYMLGVDGERTYLVIFQNDKELRPTGGFITAYSIMKVNKAKFEPVESDDIYHLDAVYKPNLPAPQPIIDYIKGPYKLTDKLYLRDMNWSPDYSVFIKDFIDEIGSVGIESIDGVIAMDTQALVYILDVLGTIGVPGYGNFSNDLVDECNCPQVIFELESFADVEGPVVWDPAGTGRIIYQPPNADNRKKIIGPLMNSIFSNVMGQPKEKLPGLFEAVLKSVTEKHVLFYFINDAAQKAVTDFGIAGTLDEYNGDYLYINDANLGGRKSNLYTTQEVNQEIEVAKDGTVQKTLTITYKNTEEFDGWLNSVLPNWVRIYVPKGSKLVDSSGFEQNVDPYEELGKTVYAGYFELRPQGVVKVSLTYQLPIKVKDVYPLLIQKQPGTGSHLYSVNIGKQQEEFFLTVDKKLNYSL